MLRECADTLGIGIPTMFVISNIGVLNASTYCFEDADPLITMHSSMLERLTDMELKSVVGHECGHIHNNHGIYNVAVEIIKGASASFIPGVGQILALLAQRLTAKEIAQKLVVSEQTVKRHRANIYQKLGVNSRREAVAASVTLGIIPTSA
jgi:DNA-binding CsgD family transcriptional regulator